MKTYLKVLALAAIMPAVMGNEQCEPQAAPETRKLKRQVELSKIQAQKINFPGAENFDFEYVVNAQILDAVSQDDRFVVAYASGDPMVPVQVSTRDRIALSPPGAAPMAQNLDPFGDPYDPNLCVARAPLMMIAGQIRSFEVVSGGGLWFGFTPKGNGNGPMGGTNIDVQFAQMEVGLVGYHPLTRTVYGTGMALPSHTKVDINLSIDFGQFSLGPKFFFQSRLGGVTMRGLKESLKRLTVDLDAKAEREQRPIWESRVVRDYDTHVTIRAGRRHGLKIGDEFAIYNLDHYWEDESQPCRSRYLGAVRNSEQPVAILKATSERDLGDEFARLEVVAQDENGSRRMPGAQVVIHKLMEDEVQKPKNSSNLR